MNLAQRVNHTQKILTIASQARNSGSESEFDIDVNMPKSNAFNKASVVMLEMFKSWYTLDATTTNTFTINVNAGGDQVVTIPSGINYTSASLALTIQGQLAGLHAGMTCVINAGNSKMVITHPTLNFTILATNEMAQYMGFVGGVVSTSSGFSLTSPNIVNLQRYDVLHVRASGIQNNNDNILISVFPSGYANNSTIRYASPDSMTNSVTVENSSFNNMRFTVEDKYGKKINFNGINWQMILTFWNEC